MESKQVCTSSTFQLCGSRFMQGLSEIAQIIGRNGEKIAALSLESEGYQAIAMVVLHSDSQFSATVGAVTGPMVEWEGRIWSSNFALRLLLWRFSVCCCWWCFLFATVFIFLFLLLSGGTRVALRFVDSILGRTSLPEAAPVFFFNGGNWEDDWVNSPNHNSLCIVYHYLEGILVILGTTGLVSELPAAFLREEGRFLFPFRGWSCWQISGSEACRWDSSRRSGFCWVYPGLSPLYVVWFWIAGQDDVVFVEVKSTSAGTN